MVKIRLRSVGAKKQPSYRIVVADSRSPRDGRFIEAIGFHNPRTEPETVTGRATRSMIFGGRVLVEKVEAEFMGMPFVGEARTGFDNVTRTYWSTWIDNMSTGLFNSTGKRQDENTLVFRGQGPNPMVGGMVQQKGVIHFEDEGSERHEMFEERGGEWVKTMEITYTPQ